MDEPEPKRWPVSAAGVQAMALDVIRTVHGQASLGNSPVYGAAAQLERARVHFERDGNRVALRRIDNALCSVAWNAKRHAVRQAAFDGLDLVRRLWTLDAIDAQLEEP